MLRFDRSTFTHVRASILLRWHVDLSLLQCLSSRVKCGHEATCDTPQDCAPLVIAYVTTATINSLRFGSSSRYTKKTERKREIETSKRETLEHDNPFRCKLHTPNLAGRPNPKLDVTRGWDVRAKPWTSVRASQCQPRCQVPRVGSARPRTASGQGGLEVLGDGALPSPASTAGVPPSANLWVWCDDRRRRRRQGSRRVRRARRQACQQHQPCRFTMVVCVDTQVSLLSFRGCP